MATTIITKNGSGAPLAGDLTAGELAVDLTNKRLYSKDSGGTVIELGTNAGSSTFADLTVSGDLTVNGSFEYGHSGISASDADTASKPGFYQTSDLSTATNYPASIGTSGPASLVTIAGLNANNHTQLAFGQNGNNAFFRNYRASNYKDWLKIITDDGSGNVGIGTDSPDAQLEVSAGGTAAIRITDTATIGSVNRKVGALEFYQNDASGGAGIGSSITAYHVNISGDTDLRFQTGNNTERMRIDSNGNVGIGTDTPSSYNSAGENLVVAGSGNTGMSIVSGSSSAGTIYFADGTSGSETYRSFIEYTHSDDTLKFGTAGSARMYIDDTGKVGIGDSSPDAGLTVHNNAGAVIANSNIARQTYTSVGQLQVSTAGAGGILVHTEDSTASGFLGFGDGAVAGRIEYAHSSDAMSFMTGSNTRMTLDATGNLLVGTTNVSAAAGIGTKILYSATAPTLSQVGSINTDAGTALSVYSTGASAYRFYVGYGGGIYATSTSITAISDESLKENIRDLDKGLEAINSLQPRRFDWKEGNGNDIMGFVAQEVREVMPELVHEYKYSRTEAKLGLKMGDMIPSMVKAIQELSSQVDELKAQVAELQGAN